LSAESGKSSGTLPSPDNGTNCHPVEDLKGIEEYFWPSDNIITSAMATGPRVQVICGHARVGKTTLALEYGAGQTPRYLDGIFVVDGPTGLLIRDHCQNLGNMNETKDYPVQEGMLMNDRRLYLDNLISYVQNHSRSLIILDDVHNLDSLPDELFSLPVSVHILVTTRTTVHTHCRLEDYRLIIRQSCNTHACLIDRLGSTEIPAAQQHSTESIDYCYGWSGVVVCSPPQSTVVALDHNLASISAFTAGPAFSCVEVTDNDRDCPWDTDTRLLVGLKRRFQAVQSQQWRIRENCETNVGYHLGNFLHPGVSETCEEQESTEEGCELKTRGGDEDPTVSVVREKLFGSCSLSDISRQHGTFSQDLTVNLFGWSNVDENIDRYPSWTRSKYGITTNFYGLPTELGEGKETTTDGSSPATTEVAEESERCLVQTRSFHSKNIQETSNHPLITRHTANVFILSFTDFLEKEDPDQTGLFSVASHLTSLGSTGEPPVRSLPLFIIGLCNRAITGKEKTEFETKVAKTLRGLSSVFPAESGRRLCYYLYSGDETKDAKGMILSEGSEMKSIRHILMNYGKKWGQHRPLVEKEIAFLEKLVSCEGNRFQEARLTLLSSKDTGNLLETAIQDNFHDKGVILCPPTLQWYNTVVDLDVLCDCIDTLIEACPQDVSVDHLPALASLKEKGIAGKEVINELIRSVPEGSTRETVLRLLDYYSICLQPRLAGQPKLPYVKSSVAIPPRVHGGNDIVIPHRLPQKLPSIMESRTSIAPLAIRCKDIEIPRFLFYQLAWLLRQRFPVAWQMAKDEARFCVDHGHTLSIVYKKLFIALTMEVRRKGVAFSDKTGMICDEVRQFVLDAMTSLKSEYRLEGLHWELVGVVFPDDAKPSLDECDFILGAQSTLSLDSMWTCFSDSGQDYEAPETLFLWFNLSGTQRKGPTTETNTSTSGMYTSTSYDHSNPLQFISKNYGRLCRIIDPYPILQLLSDRHLLNCTDADYCREPVVNSMVSIRLLRLLDDKEAGGDLLRQALQATQQDNVIAELWTSVPPQSIELLRARETTVSTGGRQVQTQEAVTPPETRVTMQQPFYGKTESESNARAFAVPQGRGSSAVVPSSPPYSPVRPVPETSGVGSSGPVVPSRTDSRDPTIFDTSNIVRQSTAQGSVLGSPRESSGRSPALQYTNISRESVNIPMERHAMGTATPQPGLTWTGNLPKWSQATAPSPSPPAVPQIPHVETSGEPQIHPIFEAKYYHIERATDGFNDRSFRDGGKRLGSGSFGTVYYGLLHSEDGKKFEVAIKRLKKASTLNAAQVALSRKQFGTEMHILTRYVHRNIVKLIGFSSDGPELCLIYEYMQRGALSHRLDCKDGSAPLDWKIRISIAEDLMNAIDFLHNGYRQSIIHRDVKSSNVLIGGQWEAKLSDFGLAFTAGDGDQRPPSPGPSVGTRPYMSPEAFEGVVTTKIDVYGYGVILYELATGLPPYSSKKKQDLKSYIDDIQRQHVDLMKMLDPKARFPKGRNDTFGLDLLDIAQRATIKKYTDRPSIKDLQLPIKKLSETSKRR
jgi:hypothetical protein